MITAILVRRVGIDEHHVSRTENKKYIAATATPVGISGDRRTARAFWVPKNLSPSQRDARVDRQTPRACRAENINTLPPQRYAWRSTKSGRVAVSKKIIAVTGDARGDRRTPWGSMNTTRVWGFKQKIHGRHRDARGDRRLTLTSARAAVPKTIITVTETRVDIEEPRARLRLKIKIISLPQGHAWGSTNAMHVSG